MIHDKASGAVPSTPASTPSSPTPNIRQSHNQRDNFADSLRRQESNEKDSSKSGEKEGKSEKSSTDGQKIVAVTGQQARGDQEEQSGQRQDGITSGGFTNAAMTNQVAAAKGAAAALPPEISAHIEKIAAAIQEMAGKGTNAQFELRLPLGSAALHSAVLGRDAAGNIAIQLQGQGRMPEEIMKRISADLAYQLRQRKLRIGDVSFTDLSKGKGETGQRVTRRS